MKTYYVATTQDGYVIGPSYYYTNIDTAYPDINDLKAYIRGHTYFEEHEYVIMTVSEYRKKFNPTKEFIGIDTFLDV